MKKSIIFLALCAISLSCFAGGPSTRDLAATDEAIIADIEAIKKTLSEDSSDIKRNAFVDSLQAKISETHNAVEKPIASADDMKYLIGVLLGVLMFFVNNGLYRIKVFEDWVKEKWSKTWFTITLGAVATLVAGVIASIRGDADLLQIGIWLVTSWGTNFGMYAAIIKKELKA